MDLLAQLRRDRVLAIVRGDDPAAALNIVRILAEEDIDLIEVSLTSRDALAVVKRAREETNDVLTIGAGTVITAADARAAADTGASFLVTPCLGAGVTEGVRLGLPVLAGALTPSEVAAAMDSGAFAVKLFPAQLGGPSYLRALRAPFPHVPFVPFGGIDVASAAEYLELGAVAVGVGSPLLADAPSGGDLTALRDRARQLRAAVRPFAEETA